MRRARLTPSRRTTRQPAADSEHAHQVALIERARAYEHVWPALKTLIAIPNGGHRHKVTAAKLKAEGVRAGVSDLGLFAPRGQFHGIWLELKAPSRAREGVCALTEAQLDWLAQMTEAGYAVALAFGCDAGWEAVRYYLAAEDEPFQRDAQVVASLAWIGTMGIDVYRPAGWDAKRRRAA